MNKLRPSTLLAFLLLPLASALGQPSQAPDDIYWDLRFPGSSGMEGQWYSAVRAFAIVGEDLFAAGFFATASGIDVGNVALWDGQTWRSFGQREGSGTNGAITSMLAVDSTVYMGGAFTRAGGLDATNIVGWHVPSQSWVRLSSGIAGNVLALAADGDELIVGGRFGSAGGVTATNLARWKDGQWTPILTTADPSHRISSLLVDGDRLYVGGYFDTIGGVKADNVAWLDLTTNTWHAMGGVTGVVDAMTKLGDDIYVGGMITAAGSTPVKNLARWRDGVWSDVAGGISGGFTSFGIATLAGSGERLFVGGNFTQAGGSEIAWIAEFNTRTATWTSLGSGLSGCEGFECDPGAYALLVDGDHLWVGGGFIEAGGQPSSRVARWNIARTSGVDEGVAAVKAKRMNLR